MGDLATSIYYFFSTTAQSVAAMVAVGGTMAVLRLQILNTNCENTASAVVDRFFGMLKMYMEIEDALDVAERIERDHPTRRQLIERLYGLMDEADRDPQSADLSARMVTREGLQPNQIWPLASRHLRQVLEEYPRVLKERNNFKAPVVATTILGLSITALSVILTTSPAWNWQPEGYVLLMTAVGALLLAFSWEVAKIVILSLRD